MADRNPAAKNMKVITVEALGSVLTKDVYERLCRPDASSREQLLVARITTLAVAALVAVGAAYVQALGGAFEANKILMGLIGVPIVIPSVFGILWKRPNTKGVVLCILLSKSWTSSGMKQKKVNNTRLIIM